MNVNIKTALLRASIALLWIAIYGGLAYLALLCVWICYNLLPIAAIILAIFLISVYIRSAGYIFRNLRAAFLRRFGMADIATRDEDDTF